MGYPVPTLAELAAYSGRSEDSYGLYVDEALKQATLLFVIATGLTEAPTDATDLQIATYGILSMTDAIYLSQPSAEAFASPFQSESIGSYSYSLGSRTKILRGEKTGVDWFDLAVDRFRIDSKGNVSYSQVDISFGSLYRDEAGNLVVLGPADIDAPSNHGFYNTELSKSDLPGWPS